MQPVTEKIGALYQEIDTVVRYLEQLHGTRLQCGRGCTSCCVDAITVWAVEAEHIRLHCSDLPAAGDPHPTGRCAFLDSAGACRIYPWRPYVCRTQGLPLHWTEEQEDGSVVAYRDICPENNPGVPVEELDEDSCWKIGPVEELLAAAQIEFGNGEMKRIALRDLFENS